MTSPQKVEVIVYKQGLNGIEFLALKSTDRNRNRNRNRDRDRAPWQPCMATLKKPRSLKVDLSRELEAAYGIKAADIVSWPDRVHQFSSLKDGVLLTEYIYGVEVSADVTIRLSPELSEFRWGSLDEISAVYQDENSRFALRKMWKILQKRSKELISDKETVFCSL